MLTTTRRAAIRGAASVVEVDTSAGSADTRLALPRIGVNAVRALARRRGHGTFARKRR